MMTRSLTSTTLALTLFFAAAAVHGQTAKLVVAGHDGWTTTVAARNTSAAAATLPLTDCTSGPLLQLGLEPGAHALVRNIVPWLCALRGAFGLMDVPDVGRLETHLRYRDHSGATSFYVIPALRMKLERSNDSARVPMIVNDDVEQTWAVVFGDPGPITFEIFNEHGTLVHKEVADEKDFISHWKMLIHRIEYRIPIGTLVITEGDKTRPGLPVDDETYYGFVIVGARDGSSNYVRVWE